MSTPKESDHNREQPAGFDLSRMKFNNTAVTETTREVIKPKVDDATKMRRLILGAVIALAIVGILGLQFMRSGRIWERPADDRLFHAGEQDFGR